MRSWQEKVVLSVIDGKDGQLLATSVCTSMQLFDWGKNKQNFDKLIAAMQQVQNSHNMPSNVSKAVDNTACAYTLEEQNTVLSHIRHFYGGIKGITKKHCLTVWSGNSHHRTNKQIRLLYTGHLWSRSFCYTSAG